MANLVTADSGAATPVVLDGIGFRHRRTFTIYAEIVDYRDLDAAEYHEGAFLQCEAERLSGPKEGWWVEVAGEHLPPFSERADSNIQVLWAVRLDAGQWRIVLRINGRVVAEREVMIAEVGL